MKLPHPLMGSFMLIALGNAGYMYLRRRDDCAEFFIPRFNTGLRLPTLYEKLSPFLDYLDFERVQNVSRKLLQQPRVARMGLGLINHCDDQPVLGQDQFGLHFRSPLGVGSGLDNSGRAVDGLLDFGLGYVEVGNITPFIQHGSAERPRVFRSHEEGVLIDNSENMNAGAKLVDSLLERSYKNHKFFSKAAEERGVVGVSLGFSDHHDSSDQERVVNEMKLGFERVMRNAAYVTVDLSQNVPLDREHIEKMLRSVLAARAEAPEDFQLRPKKQPFIHPHLSAFAQDRRKEGVGRASVLIKVSPDWTEEQHAYIARLCMGLGLDGVEVADSTMMRPNRTADIYYQPGRMSGHCMPIVSAGAIDSGEEAYDKLRAGASLLHLNHTLIQHGPRRVLDIQNELLEELRKDGVQNVREIVGADSKHL